jgi:undecaprenyl-diphosphatase
VPSQIPEQIKAFDRIVDSTFERVRGHRAIDRLFYSASALGDFSLLWHIIGTARALQPAHERQALRLEVALGLESLTINTGVKTLFRRARPVREEHLRHRLRQPRSSSFPSGHATSGFMAATLLSDDGRSRGARGWYLLAAIVAASRIHVGIHHASDVVIGALIGTGLGRLGLWLWPLPSSRRL